MKTELYELMCSINARIIRGDVFQKKEIKTFLNIFLEHLSSKNDVQSFHRGVYALVDEKQMYPLFYIPPYNNGKKLYTINGILPKTHIYASNSYELEILRILNIFCKENILVEDMLYRTKERLKTTCFGNYCSLGECFETSLVTLRFLANVFPNEEIWIESLFSKIKNDIDRKISERSHSNSLYYYYWLILSEMRSDMSIPVIRKYENKLKGKLENGFRLGTEKQKRYNIVSAYIVRNSLMCLPEYKALKDIKPYIKNDTLYFNAEKAVQLNLF